MKNIRVYLDPIRSAESWEVLKRLVARGCEENPKYVLPEPLRQAFNLPPPVTLRQYRLRLWDLTLDTNCVISALAVSALLYDFDGKQTAVPVEGLPPVSLRGFRGDCTSRTSLVNEKENYRRCAWMLWSRAQKDQRFLPYVQACIKFIENSKELKV